MRAKDELMRLWYLNEQIKLYMALADKYRLMAQQCVSSVNTTPNTSGGGDRVGAFTVLMVEAERKLDVLQDEFCDLSRQIDETIAKIDNQAFRDVLRYRYLAHFSWREVAEKMNYSLRHTTKLHGWALVEYDCVRGKE